MIGELNKRIKFARSLVGRDDEYGGQVERWIESAEMWARVEHKAVGSEERKEASKLTAMTMADITIRYRKGLSTADRIVYDGLLWRILSLLPDAKKCFLTMETVQLGALREQALSQQDGQTLTDGSGNTLTWDNIADQNDNYQPPQLVFTDSGGNNFEMQ